MDPDKIALFQTIFPFIAIIVSVSIGGWVLNTWLRIKHGYPLDGAWGQAVYPEHNRGGDRADQAAVDRECAAARRAGLDQGPARQCRAHRHGRQPSPHAGDRIPARAQELSHGFRRSRHRLHRHRHTDDRDLDVPAGLPPSREKARARGSDRGRPSANPGYTRQLEERLRVLERIVTDQGHGVAHDRAAARRTGAATARARWKERGAERWEFSKT